MSGFADVASEYLNNLCIKNIEVTTDCINATCQLVEKLQSKGLIGAQCVCKNVSHTGSAVFPVEMLGRKSIYRLIERLIMRHIESRQEEAAIVSKLTSYRLATHYSKTAYLNRETIYLWERMRTARLCLTNFTTFAKSALACSNSRATYIKYSKLNCSLCEVSGFEDW